MKKLPLITTLSLGIFILLIGCKKNKYECSADFYLITNYYDISEKIDGEFLCVFQICESLFIADTINMSSFGYSHGNIVNNFVSIKLPGNYTIEKIVRETKYNAVIWHDYNAFKLSSINYTAKREIPFYDYKNFKRNIYRSTHESDRENLKKIDKEFQIFKNAERLIYYPEIKTTDFVLNNFKNISREELRKAINLELEKPNNQEQKLYLNNKINLYNEGDFVKQNDFFSIANYDVYLILSMRHSGENLQKVLMFNNRVGM